MRVLVACEYSGRVRDAFIANGHDAMSVDLLPTDRPGPHYQGDVFDVVGEGWDLMVMHPPCTYLSRAGARWLYGPTPNPERWNLLREGAEFFRRLWNAPIALIAAENPRMLVAARDLIGIELPDQMIEPWQFGHIEAKATGLWLKGLPKLTPTKIVDTPQRTAPKGERFTLTIKNAHRRSETFQGIADAMGAQWGAL